MAVGSLRGRCKAENEQLFRAKSCSAIYGPQCSVGPPCMRRPIIGSHPLELTFRLAPGSLPTLSSALNIAVQGKVVLEGCLCSVSMSRFVWRRAAGAIVSCGLNITVQTGSARLLPLDERRIGGAKVFFDAEEEVLRYESD
jgi:hypothetical protein